MKILLTGGTGTIGRAFIMEAIQRQHQILVLSRNPEKFTSNQDIEYIRWDGRTTNGWQSYMEKTDAVINLAGANIGDRLWTPKRKCVIRESRLKAGEAVSQAFTAAKNRPRVLLQASAVGYYGETGDREVNESSPAASDYLGDLCVEWENSTRNVEDLGVRRIVLRTGLVLTKTSGALGKLQIQYQLFAGGPLGSGKHWWPWIHLKDQALAMLYLLENDQASGVYNLSAPTPARMADVGKALAKVLRRPFWLPIPAFALKIVLGDMSKILLEGQRAIPKRLLELGYSYQYPDLEGALREIFTP